MPVYKKSRTEITADELEALVSTPITNTAPGSKARSILEIPAAAVAEAYKYTDETFMNSFLSTASGEYLDRIGVLLGVSRNNDDDTRFRFRIHTALLYHAKANKTSIMTAAESVDGVSEIIVEAGTAGAGSFTVYVVGTNPEEVSWSLLTEVQNAIKDVAAFGAHFDVLPIRYIDVNIDMEVVLKQSSLSSEYTISVVNAVTQYIQQTRPGDILSIDGIIASVVTAVGSDNIIKVNINKLYIDGKRFTGNYQASPDQTFTVNRFINTPINVTIRR
jgi:uncharacterized phage protein gp47/JayE